MTLRYLSSGESHGPELNIILEGIPSNMELLDEDINPDLRRRQSGYGRGGRMKIEKDKVIFTGGVRHGRTFAGAPVSMKLVNRDHEKWLNVMSPAPVDEQDPEVKTQLDEKFISKVRPGHADLAGAMKYDAPDVRDVLERSSARETTSRVAVGAVCKKFLSRFGIEIFSHVLQIGEVSVGEIDADKFSSKFREIVEKSAVRVYDPKVEKEMIAHIDEARSNGDSLGGLVEVFATGVPIGLGSHVQWDRRLDGIVAQALMSVHTVKAVEIGMGLGVAEDPGSQVHDQIRVDSKYDEKKQLKAIDKNLDSGEFDPFKFRYERKTNNLGGFEAGMTNGLPIVARAALKPIPTIVSKLDSIDLATKSDSKSHFERSDVCVVPAGGVVLEAMLAFVLARAFLEKFGGDSISEVEANYASYLKTVAVK